MGAGRLMWITLTQKGSSLSHLRTEIPFTTRGPAGGHRTFSIYWTLVKNHKSVAYSDRVSRLRVKFFTDCFVGYLRERLLFLSKNGRSIAPLHRAIWLPRWTVQSGTGIGPMSEVSIIASKSFTNWIEALYVRPVRNVFSTTSRRSCRRDCA